MSKKPEIFVCTNQRAGGAFCMQSGKATFLALAKRAKERGGAVKVNTSVCMGYCAKGPNVKILGGDFYHAVTNKDLDKILDAAEAQAIEA